MNGFRRTQFWTFTEAGFLPADTTDARLKAAIARLSTNIKPALHVGPYKRFCGAWDIACSIWNTTHSSWNQTRSKSLPSRLLSLPKLSQGNEHYAERKLICCHLNMADLRPIGLHDLHAFQFPQVKLDDGIKRTNAAVPVLCVRCVVKDR
jgi:hypothetical protein